MLHYILAQVSIHVISKKKLKTKQPKRAAVFFVVLFPGSSLHFFPWTIYTFQLFSPGDPVFSSWFSLWFAFFGTVFIWQICFSAYCMISLFLGRRNDGTAIVLARPHGGLDELAHRRSGLFSSQLVLLGFPELAFTDFWIHQTGFVYKTQTQDCCFF